MFMGSAFSETSFMGLPSITVNGDEFYFDFLIDQFLLSNFNISQSNGIDFNIDQNLLFSYHVGATNIFDLFELEMIGYTDFQNGSTKWSSINASSSSTNTLHESPRPASDEVVDIPMLDPLSNCIDVLPYSKTPGLR